jgi:GTPase SAR1 family protein
MELDKIFEQKEKLLKGLNWSENPFVKDLRVQDKATFLNFYYPLEAKSIVKSLAFDSKACLLLGPKGVGKTSAMYYVYYSLPETEFDKKFIKEPPETIEELSKELGVENSSFLGLIKKPVNREYIASKLRSFKKKIAILVDEAHLLKNSSMYMEFKYLMDSVPNVRFVFSALDKESFPDSLIQLIGEKQVFQRKNFTKEEMKEIILKRINAVGGIEIPFEEAYLNEILTEHNLLTPRYIFDELNIKLASMIGVENGFEAQAPVKSDKNENITTIHADWWVLLSPSQKTIITTLLKNDGLTLQDLIDSTKLGQNTVFNALYQLRGDDEAEIKRKPSIPFPLILTKTNMVGKRKKNNYFINPKIKNLFTLH